MLLVEKKAVGIVVAEVVVMIVVVVVLVVVVVMERVGAIADTITSVGATAREGKRTS